MDSWLREWIVTIPGDRCCISALQMTFRMMHAFLEGICLKVYSRCINMNLVLSLVYASTPPRWSIKCAQSNPQSPSKAQPVKPFNHQKELVYSLCPPLSKARRTRKRNPVSQHRLKLNPLFCRHQFFKS